LDGGAGDAGRSAASMADNTSIEVWLLAAFVGTSIGLGFAAGYIARRRAWGGWTIGVGSTVVALLWPIVALGTFLLTTGRCEPRTPSDPCDGPATLLVAILTFVMPLLRRCAHKANLHRE
jgi:hypothetical protein